MANITEHELQQWIQRIVEQFHPLRVILFGSYATGQSRPDSDVDLLVVMSYEGRRLRMAARIRMALEDVLQQVVGIDILVRSPEELEWRLEMGDSFLETIVKEGKTLYDRQS